MKGIDHLVFAGPDLDAMRAAWSALGFTLTPPARHPFGTGNSLVQLESCFLELLTVVDPDRIPEHAPSDGFSFGAFNRDFLARAPSGFSMLVLDSSDARADVERYRAAGLKTYAPFDFSRLAKLPDGTEVTVGFSLAFVSHPDMPMAGFFACQQHAPQYFWKPEYQRHPNRALTVLEVALVAQEPDKYADFLSAFAQHAFERDLYGNVTIRTIRGNICCISPSKFSEEYQCDAPNLSRGPRLAGATIGVRDLKAIPAKLKSVNEHKALLPEPLFGTAIAFYALNRQEEKS
ncbi:MAG: VOC family protein [Parvibaculaceae bacterium]